MKDHGFDNAPDLGVALERAASKAEARNIEIDVEKYQAYLDDPSLSDDQKEEIIHALWIIIMAFVELGSKHAGLFMIQWFGKFTKEPSHVPFLFIRCPMVCNSATFTA